MAPTATDESPDKLWLEQSINTAGYLGAIGYGLHLAVYFASTYFVLASRKPRRWKLHIFNTFIFALGTIHIATTIRFDQLAWILDRGYEGGPYAFLLHEQYRPVTVLGLVALALVDFMLQALLMWRTWVIWGNIYVIVLPALLYIATIVITTANIVQSVHPYEGTWGPNLSLACWTMSMSLNILLSVTLTARLLWQRRKLLTLGFAEESDNPYTGVASMVIESAFLSGSVCCVFIILFARQSTAVNLLVPLILQIWCIAPQLILIQVYRGRAWTQATVNDTAARLSTLRFGREQPQGRTTTDAARASRGEHDSHRRGSQRVRQFGFQSHSVGDAHSHSRSAVLSTDMHFTDAAASSVDAVAAASVTDPTDSEDVRRCGGQAESVDSPDAGAGSLARPNGGEAASDSESTLGSEKNIESTGV